MRRWFLWFFLGCFFVEAFRFSVALWGWGAVLTYGFLAWLLFFFLLVVVEMIHEGAFFLYNRGFNAETQERPNTETDREC